MSKQIPDAVLDLARFMCSTWAAVDEWVLDEAAKSEEFREAWMRYPVLQGTRNQLNLRDIGKQPHDPARVREAVKWMLREGAP